MIPFPKEEVTPPVTNMYLDLPISEMYLRGTKLDYYAEIERLIALLFLKLSV